MGYKQVEQVLISPVISCVKRSLSYCYYSRWTYKMWLSQQKPSLFTLKLNSIFLQQFTDILNNYLSPVYQVLNACFFCKRYDLGEYHLSNGGLATSFMVYTYLEWHYHAIAHGILSDSFICIYLYIMRDSFSPFYNQISILCFSDFPMYNNSTTTIITFWVNNETLLFLLVLAKLIFIPISACCIKS